MFRPRNQIKLEALEYAPELGDLQRALVQAQKNRSSTIELPWKLKDTHLSYSLLVRAEFGPSEPVWTLYEGEGIQSHVVWSAPFTDLELLKEVISLTVAESLGVSHVGLPAQEISQVQQTRVEEKTVVGNYWQEAEAEKEAEEEKRLNSLASRQKEEPKVVAPTNPPPVPYAYFYPGYPYPIPYPIPYPYQQPGSNPNQPVAGTIPIQPGFPTGLPTNTQNQLVPQLPQPNYELVSKQKNFMLGQLLVETGVIAPEILSMILKLQEMITNGLIDTDQAIEAIKKSCNESGAIEVAALIQKLSTHTGNERTLVTKRTTPLLGEMFVRAQVISNTLLLAVLKLQEVVRSGAMSFEEACRAFKKELAGSKIPKDAKATLTPAQEEAVISLIVQAGLISVGDKETAYRVKKRHGGKIDNILAAAGKISKKTFAAAIECEQLLNQKKIKFEQVMIGLNYCERSRVGLKEAIADLGWHDL